MTAILDVASRVFERRDRSCEFRRLKFLLAQPITDGPHDTPEFLSEGVPFLSVDGIQEGELVFENCRFVSPEAHADYRRKAAPKRDDILMGKAASTGKIARVKTDLEFSIWSPLALIRSNSKRITPTFCEYALKSAEVQHQIELLCNTNTQKNIGMADIPQLVLPLLTLGKQQSIAAFLDRKTAAIDDLVKQKERLIELLQEKRQALITEAVTKGLDANVPMKESGVNWLGAIPRHWDALRGRFLLRPWGGYAPEAVVESDAGIPYLKVDELNGGEHPWFVAPTEQLVTAKGLRPLPPNAILIPKRGAAIFTNKVRLSTQACVFDSNVMGLTAIGDVDPRFLAMALWSRGLRDVADVSTIPQINNKHIRELVFSVPPRNEQSAIVAFVDAAEAKIARAVACLQVQRERLSEYRQALISAAVTGQLDVSKEAT